MNHEIRSAMQLFENKLASFWQLDGEMQWCEDDRIYKMESRQRILETEVNKARDNLIAAIERLEKKPVEADWEDRMGGQFTQEEINEASRGGHGW